ncbi:MAG: nucleotide exchange factor GrpE [Flavisolibacter sp.]|jgi:molecular chaperone GrpE|nr:nucleotide exchange factor GrpE [Flavisolibacter sp.]
MNKDEAQEQESNQEQEAATLNINSDENIAGTQLLNDPVAEESEMEALRMKIQELNDRYLRQAAEFDNFKRRNARERIELIQTAGKDVITELLDVLDDSERAQKQLDSTEDISQVKEGVQLVFNKLRNTLGNKGLKPIESVNKDFNVDLHEAITEIEAGDEMKGKVVAEVQKGYYLNDKIIRFSKVVVGK